MSSWLQHALNLVDHLADASKQRAAEVENEQFSKQEARQARKAAKQSAKQLGQAFGAMTPESCCTAKRDGSKE